MDEIFCYEPVRRNRLEIRPASVWSLVRMQYCRGPFRKDPEYAIGIGKKSYRFPYGPVALRNS